MKWRVRFHGSQIPEVVEADRIYVSNSGALQFLSKVTKAESEPAEGEKPKTHKRFIKGIGWRALKGADVGSLVSLRGFNVDQWRDYTIEE